MKTKENHIIKEDGTEVFVKYGECEEWHFVNSDSYKNWCDNIFPLYDISDNLYDLTYNSPGLLYYIFYGEYAEYYERDENNHITRNTMIHFCDNDINDYYYKYDDLSREIYVKHIRCEYDSDRIQFKSITEVEKYINSCSEQSMSYITETWTTYNDDGSYEKRMKCESDIINIYRYDKNGNQLYAKYVNFNYTTNRNEVITKVSDGKNETEMIEVDGSTVFFKDDSNDYKCWKVYNDKGYLIYQKEKDKSNKSYRKQWCEYDDNGNKIFMHCKNYDINESWIRFDENQRIVYQRTITYKDKTPIREIMEITDYDGNKREFVTDLNSYEIVKDSNIENYH